ncbi:aromatic ring-hydroxylating oxygenase subunit alpha [Aliiroseovarius sp. YM-037]|uniref:aromatic ring-hydroxylating oxygenase subunit alpha n=1 Tax=Aliiroseovarius sp. YM-037 TaxID=3341728 RepID=UPI003A813081
MRTDLSRVHQPIDRASGLPNAHYVDPEIFAEEREALLFETWAGLAAGADVPEPGDAKPVDFLGVPILLMRGKDGVVRVFQNTCRHRGMILVEEARKIEGAIRCPYHSWCYSHKGELVSTPHVGGPGHNVHEAIDKSTLGLTEIRSHLWRDVVWINMSGDAPAFEDAMAGAMARWAEFEKPIFHGGADSRFELEVNCNWKLAVENYAESYHLPWVHPGLNSYSRLEDHYNIEAPGQFSGQGTLVYRQLKDHDGNTFPDFQGLSDKWDTAAEYLCVYPNVLLGAHRDHVYSIILVPHGPERTVEHVHIYYPTDDTDPALRAKNTQQWKSVFVEDVFVVEGMQKGRHAPLFDGGRFSPAMDGPTHCFHAWAAERIEGHRTKAMAAE